MSRKRYTGGRPCRTHGPGERYRSTRKCCACVAMWSAPFKASPEYKKAKANYDRTYRAANPHVSTVKERHRKKMAARRQRARILETMTKEPIV